jgi:ankyrin repeat protein
MIMAMHNQVDELEELDLHEECKKQCRSSIIRRYIELYPDALAKADSFRNLPLHVLLINRSSPAELAFYMIDKYPAALQQRSSDGCLPLHMECMGPCRSSIIAKCIELYPESLCTVDDGGYLPLHSVLWNSSSSVEDALMMMEMHPRGLEVKQSNGYLPLHIECMGKCRSSVIAKCIELYPESLRTVDDYGYLPLHQLLRNTSSSVEDALMMIEIHPRALEVQLSNGNIPLHIECIYQCRPSIISKCIELYPQGLEVVNNLNYLPLHSLLSNTLLSTDAIALMMIAKYPAALEHRNYNGLLPIHIGCHRQCSSAVLAKCIEIYPVSLSMSDTQGSLPFHLLLYNENSSVEDALMMMEKYPAALQHFCGDYLPLHIECGTQCRAVIISKHIEIYPESLDENAIDLIISKIDKTNFNRYTSVLSIVFTARPMSLYNHDPSIKHDIRFDSTYRRRILNLLPLRVLTPIHYADYRDLNWQPRAAMMMFLSQMQI